MVNEFLDISDCVQNTEISIQEKHMLDFLKVCFFNLICSSTTIKTRHLAWLRALICEDSELVLNLLHSSVIQPATLFLRLIS